MSVQGMREAWHQLRPRVAGFYELATPFLEGVVRREPIEELDRQAQAALDASSRVRAEAEEQLVTASGAEYAEVSVLLLAAATVDAMLACDIAMLDPELGMGYTGALDDPGVEFAAIGSERTEILSDADALFGLEATAGSAGAQAITEPAVLTREVHQATQRLVKTAAEPERELVRGFLTVSIGELVAVADLVPHLTALAGEWHHRAHRACGFLREHVQKIAALGHDEAIEVELEHELPETFGEQLSRRLDIRDLLARLAAVEAADEQTSTAIDRAATRGLCASAVDLLIGDLIALEAEYRKQTEWLTRSARWVRRGATPLIRVIDLIAPGAGTLAGRPILAGAFMVGGLYVAYSLTDRIDARQLHGLDRIEGIVRLVDRRL